MNAGRVGSALVLAVLMAAPARSAERRLSFVSCPIVRDTKEVPCWITRYRGETYYLGIQQDITAEFYPPQLKHRILVEGVPTSGARICGGVVLKPVAVSPLPEIDRNCDQILPGGKYRIDFAPRGAGPNHGGVPATDPAAAGQRARAPSIPDGKDPRTFTVRFDFDNDFMTARNTAQVSAAARYAAAHPGARIRVMGHRATSLLTDGGRLVEKAGIGRVRALKVGQALREIGAPDASLEVSWNDASEPADGISDFENRRVDILVTP
jgi:outer membrane protein OmpA-like peptidoglycan-associated protein